MPYVSCALQKNWWTDLNYLYVVWRVFLLKELPDGGHNDCTYVNILMALIFLIEINSLTR